MGLLRWYYQGENERWDDHIGITKVGSLQWDRRGGLTIVGLTHRDYYSGIAKVALPMWDDHFVG